MRSYDNAEAIAAAPETTTDPQLRSLLADRVHDWRKRGLLDLTHLLIVEAGDTEADFVDAIGFSPLVSSDGLRFGSVGFEPSFDWLENRGGWWQLITTVGNDGFAFELFIEDAPGVLADLRTLCRTYAR